jgi:hypothetical protein
MSHVLFTYCRRGDSEKHIEKKDVWSFRSHGSYLWSLRSFNVYSASDRITLPPFVALGKGKGKVHSRTGHDLEGG